MIFFKSDPSVDQNSNEVSDLEGSCQEFWLFLRFLDCPEVNSESEAISEQWNAIVYSFAQFVYFLREEETKTKYFAEPDQHAGRGV